MTKHTVGIDISKAWLDAFAAPELDPSPYSVPDLFMNELLAVLCRLPASRPAQVQEALALVEALGITRVAGARR